MDGKKIIKNCVKCKECGDIIISITENFVACKCGETKIAGGCHELLREGESFEELTEYYIMS